MGSTYPGVCGSDSTVEYGGEGVLLGRCCDTVPTARRCYALTGQRWRLISSTYGSFVWRTSGRTSPLCASSMRVNSRTYLSVASRQTSTCTKLVMEARLQETRR